MIVSCSFFVLSSVLAERTRQPRRALLTVERERAAWMDDQCDQLVGRSAGDVGRAGGGRAVGGHDVTGRRDEAGTPLQSDAARRRLPAGHAARRARDRRRLQAPAGQRRHGAQTHRLPTSNVRRRRRRRRQLTDGQHRLQRCCCRHY